MFLKTFVDHGILPEVKFVDHLGVYFGESCILVL